jgi:hypothetical protein
VAFKEFRVDSRRKKARKFKALVLEGMRIIDSCLYRASVMPAMSGTMVAMVAVIGDADFKLR